MPKRSQNGAKRTPSERHINFPRTLDENIRFVRFSASLGRYFGTPTRTNDLVFSSVSPARGATFAQNSLSIFMIFVRNEGSIRRNSKEIEKYFERGPEIQKVVKKHLHYTGLVKVGSEGPRHEWLAGSDFKGIQRVWTCLKRL